MLGNFLVVQRLGLGTFTAGALLWELRSLEPRSAAKETQHNIIPIKIPTSNFLRSKQSSYGKHKNVKRARKKLTKVMREAGPTRHLNIL